MRQGFCDLINPAYTSDLQHCSGTQGTSTDVRMDDREEERIFICMQIQAILTHLTLKVALISSPDHHLSIFT